MSEPRLAASPLLVLLAFPGARSVPPVHAAPRLDLRTTGTSLGLRYRF